MLIRASLFMALTACCWWCCSVSVYGVSVPVACSWDPNDLSYASDPNTYGLTQCEMNAGPLPTTSDGSTTQLSIFYASTQQNPEEGQCPGDAFVEWSTSNASRALITLQIRDCCFSPVPLLLFNGPKKKLWNSLMSSKYPSCLDNQFANPTTNSSSEEEDSTNLTLYTFGNDQIGSINFVWENNLTLTSGGGPFSFVTVDFYPPRYFSPGEQRPTIVDANGNVYVLQTYLTTSKADLTNDPGVDEAFLSYIGTEPGQCCSSLPDGWTVSVEEYNETLCAGCCNCNNTVFTDDLTWTWALVTGPPQSSTPVAPVTTPVAPVTTPVVTPPVMPVTPPVVAPVSTPVAVPPVTPTVSTPVTAPTAPSTTSIPKQMKGKMMPKKSPKSPKAPKSPKSHG